MQKKYKRVGNKREYKKQNKPIGNRKVYKVTRCRSLYDKDIRFSARHCIVKASLKEGLAINHIGRIITFL